MTAPLAHVLRGSAGQSGPVVVCLHGFLGCLSDWEEIALSLEDSYRILLIDLPGHGNSPVIDDDGVCTVEACALGLVDLLDALGIEKVHLIGYSMGGRLALYFLLTHPERCDRAILESSSPGLRTEVERTERRRQDAQLVENLERDGVDAFVRHWYRQPLFETMSSYPDRLEKLLARRRRSDPFGLAVSLRTMGTGAQPSLWQRLSSINSPLLLVAGEKDRKFAAIAGEMADLCPTAEVCIIRDSGHNVHFEQPERFVREVKDFLQRDS